MKILGKLRDFDCFTRDNPEAFQKIKRYFPEDFGKTKRFWTLNEIWKSLISEHECTIRHFLVELYISEVPPNLTKLTDLWSISSIKKCFMKEIVPAAWTQIQSQNPVKAFEVEFKAYYNYD